MPTCIFRVQLNTLLSLWYTVGCTLLHSWLLYLGFVRYRLYMDMQWPSGAFPRIWLTVYISLLGTCIPILALFLAFGLLKSGNLASDNEQFGARPKRTIELIKGGMGSTAVRHRNGNAYRLCHCLRSAWLHAPPAAQCLHVLLALLQLFVQQIMLAQLYRWGFINSGDFLNTELDWVFQRARQLATNLPMGETRLQSFRISTEELSASPVAPNILPILMHTRLFGIPLEFVNLLIALIAFSTVYPSVFWRVSKPFALLFTTFLGIHSLSLIWTYLGFSVLFRIQETNFYGGRPVGMGQHLWALRSLPLLYHPLAIVALFWLTVALMHLAPIALYSFGYGKFAAAQNSLLRMRRSSVPCTADGGSDGCLKNGINGWSYGSDIICDGYTPHVLAIILLLTIAATKAPAFYAIGLIYQKEERPLLLWCLVTDLLYLFSWILLWLLCTVKCRWHFRVHYDVHELIGVQNAHKTADGGQAVRGRAPAELKGALLLVHGSDVFITDDPVAKPAIMRQVLKSCLPAQDLPSWLRAMPMPQNASVPNTQSPPRRHYVRGAEYAPCVTAAVGGQHMSDAAFLRTPEFGQRQRYQHFGATAGAVLNSDDDSPSMDVPFAAPPYQRLASLPPVRSSGDAGEGQFVSGGGDGGSISFGIVMQQRPHHQNVGGQPPPPNYGTTISSNNGANANNGSANDDYAAAPFVLNNNGQQQQQAMLMLHQHQSSAVGAGVPPIGTLSRSWNTATNGSNVGGIDGSARHAHGMTMTGTAPLQKQQHRNILIPTTTAQQQYGGHQLQQQQMMASAMQQQQQHGIENYATISRRCSKSSLGSGFGTTTTTTGVPPTMPSPQLLRPRRSASVQTREQHSVPILHQRHHTQHQQQQQNGMLQFENDCAGAIYGHHQQQHIYGQFNGGNGGGIGMETHTMHRDGGDSVQPTAHKPKLLTPLLQRHRAPLPLMQQQQQKQPPQGTFIAGNGGGGWHPVPSTSAAASASMMASSITVATETGSAGGGGTNRNSMNGGGGGGTMTPSSSVTIGGGDSRVGSVASNASSLSTHPTAYGDGGDDVGTLLNGHGGITALGDHRMPANDGTTTTTTTDCATLTRDSNTKGQVANPPDAWAERNGRATVGGPAAIVPLTQGKQLAGAKMASAQMGVPSSPSVDGMERFATSVV